jgi:PTS system mannose-specific IIB component
MASIPLLRVDNRLIHGQVTAFWVRSLSCERAIIIDDATAADKFIKKILLMAMPPSTKLTIYSVEEAVKEWQENQLGSGRAMVIFKDIAGAKRTFECGFRFENLQIGGSPRTTGQKQVSGSIYLNEDEAKMLNELESEGVEIILQVLSEQKPVAWKNVRRKAFPNLDI